MSKHNFLEFQQLAHTEDWQRLQDSCSDALGVSLSTLDPEGNTLMRRSNPLNICEILADPDHDSHTFEGYCFKQKKLDISKKETVTLKHLAGLDIHFFPITVSGHRVVAYMSVGPFVLEKKRDTSFYAEQADKLGVLPKTLLDAIEKVPVFTKVAINNITAFVEDAFSHIIRIGYHKMRLGEITKEVVEIDPLFSSYYERKILKSLLNACTLSLDADSGSVMTVDKSDHLHIAASSRLDKKIVEKTDIRVGEGIAGMAAATSESIVLPQDSEKGDISKNMKRSQIKSSMIMPFHKANSNDVYGVLNLNVMRQNKDFSDKDITLTKELVNLASIALTAIQ